MQICKKSVEERIYCLAIWKKVPEVYENTYTLEARLLQEDGFDSWKEALPWRSAGLLLREKSSSKVDGSLAERKLTETRKEKDHNRQNIGWRSLNFSFSSRGQEASGDSLNHQVPRGEVKLWGLGYLSHLQVWFRFTAANSISKGRVFPLKIIFR